MVTDELQKRILINMRLLYQYGNERCTLENILKRDYHSHSTPWPSQSAIQTALKQLENSGFIHQSCHDLGLTQTGTEIALGILEDFFSKTMVNSYNSPASHSFRENLYGIDLFQYNVSTRNQFDAIRTFLNPGPGKTLLDLGCGLGGITEYFADFGAKMLGVDLAEDLIKTATARTQSFKHLSLKYEVHDIATYQPTQKYDGIYAIDAIQFLSEKQQAQAVNTFYKALKPGGIMAFLYSQISPAEEITSKPQVMPPEKLRIGQALISENIPFEAVDFSDEYIPFWQRQCNFAQTLSDNFEAEGLSEIMHERMDEGSRILGEVLSGENAFGRYLYVVRKPL